MAVNIDLTWQGVPNALGYTLRWREQGTEEWTYGGTYGSASTEFVIRDLTEGNVYVIQVRGFQNPPTNPSPWVTFIARASSDVTTVDLTVGVPGNVTVSPIVDGAIVVSWDAVDGAIQYDVASQPPNRQWREDRVDAPNTSTQLNVDPTVGDSWKFRVRAINLDGNYGPWSDVVTQALVDQSASVTEPTEGVTVVWAGEYTINLEWVTRTGVGQWRVRYRRTGQMPEADWVYAPVVDLPFFTIGTLQFNASYDFQVRSEALGVDDETATENVGPWSASTIGTTGASIDYRPPRIDSATSDDNGEIRLVVTTFPSQIYNELEFPSALRFFLRKTGETAWTSYTVRDLERYVINDKANSKAYRLELEDIEPGDYQIRAIASYRDRRQSAMTSGTNVTSSNKLPVLPIAEAVEGREGTVRSIALFWTPEPRADHTVVEITDETLTATEYVADAGEHFLRFDIPETATGIQLLRIQHRVAADSSWAQSDWSDSYQLDVTPDPDPDTALPAPISLSVAADNAALDVSWVPIPFADFFRLRWKETSDSEWLPFLVTDHRAYRIDNLKGTTSYDVALKACHSGVPDSPWSDTVTVVTKFRNLPAAAVPAVPTYVPGATSLKVNWAAATNATSYDLRWRIAPIAGQLALDNSWSDPIPVEGLTYTITGLTTSRTYHVQIRSKRFEANLDRGPDSAWSPTLTAIPLLPALTGVPTIYSVVVYRESLPWQRGVAWSPVQGATRYEVQIASSSNGPWFRLGYSNRSNLTFEGSYYGTRWLRVRALAPARVPGAWSAVFGVNITAPAAPPPTPSLSIAAGTDGTSLVVSIGAISGATSYQIRWLTGTGGYNAWTTVTSPHTITGLAQNTTYTVQARAVLPTGNSGVATRSQTTGAAAAPPPPATGTRIYGSLPGTIVATFARPYRYTLVGTWRVVRLGQESSGTFFGSSGTAVTTYQTVVSTSIATGTLVIRAAYRNGSILAYYSRPSGTFFSDVEIRVTGVVRIQTPEEGGGINPDDIAAITVPTERFTEDGRAAGVPGVQDLLNEIGDVVEEKHGRLRDALEDGIVSPEEARRLAADDDRLAELSEQIAEIADRQGYARQAEIARNNARASRESAARERALADQAEAENEGGEDDFGEYDEDPIDPDEDDDYYGADPFE